MNQSVVVARPWSHRQISPAASRSSATSSRISDSPTPDATSELITDS